MQPGLRPRVRAWALRCQHTLACTRLHSAVVFAVNLGGPRTCAHHAYESGCAGAKINWDATRGWGAGQRRGSLRSTDSRQHEACGSTGASSPWAQGLVRTLEPGPGQRQHDATPGRPGCRLPPPRQALPSPPAPAAAQHRGPGAGLEVALAGWWQWRGLLSQPQRRAAGLPAHQGAGWPKSLRSDCWGRAAGRCAPLWPPR